jgi:hypothetical protein
MKNVLILFSFLLLAAFVRVEGKNTSNINWNSFAAMSGSGALNINPNVIRDLCTGSGTIDLNFNQGIADLVTWNDGSDDVTRVGLGGGDYSVDLTIDGCDTTLFFTLDFPETLMATVTNAEDKNCVEGTVSNPSFGSFDVSVTGGEAPYLYSVNGEPFQTSNQFGTLGEGTFVVDVTDANGCMTQVSQDIRCVGCKISPNPVVSGGDFLVDVFFGDETETAELRIYNSNGRLIESGIDIPVVNGEVNSFPVTADLDAGMYVVLIIGDSISFSRQLIVID